jgi:enterochelin esterase-like enzyme
MRVEGPISRDRSSFLGLLLVLAAACSSVPSDSGQPNTADSQQLPGWLYSSFVHDDFQIYVHTPQGFSPDDAPNTHLVVLLDADWYMDGTHERLGNGGVVGIAEWEARAGSIPSVAVLGIGEINRQGQNMRGRDFLTGPRAFIGFVTGELLPLFYQEYALPQQEFKDVTLMGHSDGAYFSVWVLFRDAPAVFRNVIAISGDFTKPHYDVFAAEEDYYERAPDTRACLYLGVGSLEESRFLTSFTRMAEAIESRQGSKLAFSGRSYENMNHGTVVAPAFSDGLKFSFSSSCYPDSSVGSD